MARYLLAAALLAAAVAPASAGGGRCGEVNCPPYVGTSLHPSRGVKIDACQLRMPHC